jgi:predicted extracellular nuclease
MKQNYLFRVVVISMIFLFLGKFAIGQTYYNMASGNYSETFMGWTSPNTGSWSSVSINAVGTIPSAGRITAPTIPSAFVSSTSSGIQNGATNIQFLATGGTDNTNSVALDLNLNFSGRTTGNLTFDLATVNNSTNNRAATLRAYYSFDATNWMELTSSNFPYNAINNVINNQSVSIALPGEFADKPTVKIRFYCHNAGTPGTINSGSRPKISIDNVMVSSDPLLGSFLSVNDVSNNESNAGVTNYDFVVSLSSAAPAGGVTFEYSTANGTATEPLDYTAIPVTTGSIPEGGLSTTITVAVNGDLTPELNENFFLNITNLVGASIADGQGQGTILNDDLTPIHTIQGSGAQSPLVGATVTTRGIVTGVRGSAFFIQEPDATTDADPLTSEGVLVFTSTAPPTTAQIGNLVQVTGTIVEFVPTQDLSSPPVTEITLPTIVLVSTANPLPTPVPLTSSFPDPTGSFDQLERIEGMLASVPSLTMVAPTSSVVSEPNATATSNGVLYGVVTGVARPFREPGIQLPDIAPTGGSIPPIPVFDGNPELIRVDTDSQQGTTAIDVSTNAILTNVVGPIDYGFRSYTILPGPTNVPSIAQSGIIEAIPLADKGENQFTIASYNMERFFDTVDAPGTSDAILTPLAFENRLNKASLAIRNILKTPDVIAVVEMENLTTLQTLATKINNDAIAASNPNPNYTAYLEEGNDIGGIDVGFLLKDNVTVTEVVQESKNTTFVDPIDMSVDILNDRPSLRFTGLVNHPSGKTFPITIFVNHLRSLNGVGTNDASGIRVREKRKKQAEDLANIVQARQLANPDERIVLVGDFNAFEFNDGLVDVINTIKGTPTPDNQTAVAGDGADLVEPNLFIPTLPEGSYSYSFNGNSQFLDHGIMNQNMVNFIEKTEYVKLNADFAGTIRNDATRPERLSDHDPLVTTVNFCPTKISFVPTDLLVSSTTLCDGNSLVLGGVCPTDYTINWYDSETSTEAIGTGDGLLVSPTINNTYYATCKDVLCESDRLKLADITVQPAQYATTSNSGQAIITGTTNFMDSECNIIATLTPSVALEASGNYEAKVWIEAAPLANPYVARHYQIGPSGALGQNGGAKVTLYFTQAEFDAYNAASTSTTTIDNLPTSITDTEGIGRLKVIKYSGSSSDGTGLPSSYAAGADIITPASVLFEDGVWKVTFTVESFSGFFVNGQTVALPVNLISFKAKKQNKANLLEWKTANEKSFNGFEIQRSTNSKVFEKIGFVKGSNLENYQFIDENLASEISYYRLKMIDLDGSANYSKIVVVQSENKSTIIVGNVFPNPVNEGQVFVEITTEVAGNWKLTTFGSSGIIQATQVIQLEKGINKVSLKNANLSLGINFINFENKSGEKYIKKVLKN